TRSNGRSARRCTTYLGWPPGLRPEGSAGSLRLTCGLSVDGSLEEFCEVHSRYSFKSATTCSKVTVRGSVSSMVTKSGACTTGGIWSYNSRGKGDVHGILAVLLSQPWALRKFEV